MSVIDFMYQQFGSFYSLEDLPDSNISFHDRVLACMLLYFDNYINEEQILTFIIKEKEKFNHNSLKLWSDFKKRYPNAN